MGVRGDCVKYAKTLSGDDLYRQVESRIEPIAFEAVAKKVAEKLNAEYRIVLSVTTPGEPGRWLFFDVPREMTVDQISELESKIREFIMYHLKRDWPCIYKLIKEGRLVLLIVVTPSLIKHDDD